MCDHLNGLSNRRQDLDIATAAATVESGGKDTLANEEKLQTEQQDLVSLQSLNAGFENYRAEYGGTVRALEALLASDILQSETVRARVEMALATAKQVIDAVPGNSAVVARLLNATPLDLSASESSGIFQGFLGAVENSQDLSDAEKAAIREVIAPTERVNSGSEIEATLAAGRGTRQNPDGSSETIPFTEDDPLEVRPGVSAYTKGNREVIKAVAGDNQPVTIDVTGWPSEQIGDLAEVMAFWTAIESVGVTGLVEDIYKINNPLSLDNGFDPAKVGQLKQAISRLFGSAEGHDGGIADFDRQMGLLQYQASLLAPNGNASGVENDHNATREAAIELGILGQNGDLNLETLEEFGNFSRRSYGTGNADFDDLKQYLLG